MKEATKKRLEGVYIDKTNCMKGARLINPKDMTEEQLEREIQRRAQAELSRYFVRPGSGDMGG